MATEEELRALREAADAADQHASALLDDELAGLMAAVGLLDELKPETASQEDYDRMIKAVQEATAKNHSIATLRQNLMALGSGVLDLAKTAAGLAKTAL